MNKDINKVIKELANSFLRAYQAALASDIGINNKTNTNTLVGSKLYKQANINYSTSDDIIVNLLLNDYEVYVQNGRKSSKMPPMQPIIAWAKSKGIPTDNSTLWAIRKSIAEKGIQPRPFMNTVFNDMDNIMDSIYFDKLFINLINELNEYFNK